MIRYQATPDKKPAETPAAKTAKTPSKAKAGATAPKKDLLDLPANDADDKD